jgi:hypothetical protein
MSNSPLLAETPHRKGIDYIEDVQAYATYSCQMAMAIEKQCIAIFYLDILILPILIPLCIESDMTAVYVISGNLPFQAEYLM